MKKKMLNLKLFLKIMFTIMLIEIVFYLVAKHQIEYKEYNQIVEHNIGNIGGVIDEKEIKQFFEYEGDYISQISIKVGTYQRKNEGNLNIELIETNSNRLLWSNKIDISKLKDNSDMLLEINKEINAKDNEYYLKIKNEGSDDNTSITLYYNDSAIHNGALFIDGINANAELQMSIYGDYERKVGSYFWYVVLIINILICGLYFLQSNKEKKEKKCVLHDVLDIIETYKFMAKQLISRDFKTKYKRSVLGMLWSLLNPLLTMAVQYVVFSTIFRANIDNYPVYLLSASILFNFFTESVGGGLVSIVGNSSLIKKVNAPKYIYPITKVLSTGINLLISLIPLFIVALLTGETVSLAYLLIPYVLICVVVFCFGMAMIMSSLMVFFRDVQFLWGILSLLWMYATPMFYPASIIPEKFSFVLTWNPMYHFISFFRTIILDGVSPQLTEYIYCAAFSLVFLVFGAILFNRLEKKFVLYL